MRTRTCALLLTYAVALGSPAWSQDAPVKTIRVSGAVMATHLMSQVDPVYPPEARENKIAGVVVLHAIISDQGVVQNLIVVSGPKPLQAAALDAVRQWTYSAYVLNGNNIAVDTLITINFALNQVGGS